MDVDALASRVIDETQFGFSRSLLPSVGELPGGRFIAWNTLYAFHYFAAASLRRELARHAKPLLRLTCVQWPTWTRGFDPEGRTTADLRSVIAGLACKTAGRVRPAPDPLMDGSESTAATAPPNSRRAPCDRHRRASAGARLARLVVGRGE